MWRFFMEEISKEYFMNKTSGKVHKTSSCVTRNNSKNYEKRYFKKGDKNIDFCRNCCKEEIQIQNEHNEI